MVRWSIDTTAAACSVAPVLFDPRAHEPPAGAAWSAAAAREAIRSITRDAQDAFAGPRAWWPVHPLDAEAGDPAAFHGVYLGASGVLWALGDLAAADLAEPRLDLAALTGEALAAYDREPEFDGPLPSLWMGAGGIALVAWLAAPSPALAERLHALVSAPPARDTLEVMWGGPGLLAIAAALLERTGETRWATAWTTLAEDLVARLGEETAGCWTQHLYGSRHAYLGPAHGLAGNVALLAQRPDLLAPERYAGAVTAALQANAVREDGFATWPPHAGGALANARGEVRLQWCHGAPGMVASLARLPADPALDALLLEGGELTWAAGPLRKGPGVCHGTAGNALAFLALLQRTGDERWLERAQAFAMHATTQVEAARREHGHGRHTLWTGDLGVACVLAQCLDGTAGAPGLERW